MHITTEYELNGRLLTPHSLTSRMGWSKERWSHQFYSGRFDKGIKKSRVGCHMSGVYAGICVYADDIKLMAPSLSAISTILGSWQKYAEEFDVKFIGKKSELIIYKCTRVRPPNSEIHINNVQVPRKDKVTHLGHVWHEDIYHFGADKCIADFNRKCNFYFADFKYANSQIINVLFHKYCAAFYGSKFFPMFSNCIEDLCTAWRVAIHKVWRLPWLTHCNMLPHIAGCMDIKLWLYIRCIKLIKMVCNSKNDVVITITNMGLHGSSSITGGNKRHLDTKFDMETKNIYKIWQNKPGVKGAKMNVIYDKNILRLENCVG